MNSGAIAQRALIFAPRGRDAGAAYLADFVEEMKASGFVAETLARNKVVGATVATRENAGGGR